MIGMDRLRRGLLLLGVGGALLGAGSAQAAGEPANGFDISFSATGTVQRSGPYSWDDPGSSYSLSATRSTTGSYTAKGQTFIPVFFPVAGTAKETANFPTDQPQAQFSGTLSAHETLTDSDDNGFDSTCTANYLAAAQDVFAISYEGGAGTDIQLHVAPVVRANHNPGSITCGADDDAAGELLFPLTAGFDGTDPLYATGKTITLTQAQLGQQSFTIPVSFTNSGSKSWPNEGGVPDGYCDSGIQAGAGGSCNWNSSWSGTLTFTRRCSAADGSTVTFTQQVTGIDGKKRWLTATDCAPPGGPGAGGGGKCVVPKLVGKPLRKAKKKLKKAKCKLGEVKREKSSKANEGRVLEQSPKPGARKPAKAKVDVTVGKA